MPKIKCEQNGHWFEVKVGKNYQRRRTASGNAGARKLAVSNI